MSSNLRPPDWLTDPQWRDRYVRWGSAWLARFHAYAGWLVSISWVRFGIYAVVLLVAVSAVQDVFSWKVTETLETVQAGDPPPKPELPDWPERSARRERKEPPVAPAAPPEVPAPAPAPAASAPASAPSGKVVKIVRSDDPEAKPVRIEIGKHGVRIGRSDHPDEAATVDLRPDGLRIVGSRADGASAPPVLDIRVPPQVSEQIRREIEAATAEVRRQSDELRQREQAAEDTLAELKELEATRRELEKTYAEELRDWKRRQGETIKRTQVVRFGEVLWNLAFLWVLFSALVKATYKGRKEAEAKAAAATETAEAEALKRQLVEARLNTMQAQIEPHFLFNTLASIDHLIETDPQRASQMQKNLIALLRASMPSMREAAGGQGKGLRDLRREMAVVRPYLDILQVRMEERLVTAIDVPEGLLSAEFPPMIVQGLVENAIKHGLEPKPEGGHLRVTARVEHGKLVVEVADTGLGFGRGSTQGTGVGLANTRERLQLLYGNKASLTVAENQPCGTLIRVSVPYRSNEAEAHEAKAPPAAPQPDASEGAAP